MGKSIQYCPVFKRSGSTRG